MCCTFGFLHMLLIWGTQGSGFAVGMQLTVALPMQDTLVGSTFAADNNKWLGSPQATLMGMYNGNMSAVLLQLDACVSLPHQLPPVPSPSTGWSLCRALRAHFKSTGCRVDCACCKRQILD